MEKPHLDQRILSQFDDDDAAAAEWKKKQEAYHGQCAQLEQETL